MKNNKLLLLGVGIVLLWLGSAFLSDSLRQGIKNKNDQKKMEKEKTKGETKKDSKLLFLGDVMLDRHTRQLLDEKDASWMIELIKDVFEKERYTVANLEGAVTTSESISVGTKDGEVGHYKFTFDPNQTRDFLKAARIDLVNLNNNHISNFGSEGVGETVNFLEKEKMDYIGVPKREEKAWMIKEVNGRKVGFVSFSRFKASFLIEEVEEIIKKIDDECDWVVVYAHWGVEYKLIQNEDQEEVAHRLIDAGADLIIGSHPHVVQPVEIYKNKTIFYSLGNFVFDQYFSKNVRTRLAVEATISEESLKFTLIPLYLEDNGQLTHLDENKKEEFFERLARDSKVDEKMRKEIKEGFFMMDN